MYAAFYESKGPARDVLRVGQIATPEPGPNEVQVRISVSAVNPTDTKARAGWRGNTKMAFPRVVPHQDGAGTIEMVGSNVPESRIGERVWVFEAQWQRAFGTAAEFTVVPSNQAISMPDSVGFEEAACLGIPAMTAHRCVFADGAVSGNTVFVSGGAGAVGFYAIQLAKWGNANVISTVSSSRDAEAVSRAGADHVIDRKRQDVARRVLEITNGQGVDRIIEVAFGQNAYLDASILKDNGTLAAFASDSDHEPKMPFYSYMMKNVNLRLVLVYKMSTHAHEQAVAGISECLRSEKLKHAISRRFGLDEIISAHEAMEIGSLGGKVIVRI